ncbi:nucleoside phosphorylase domain-containing protein [Aspergillus pseudocaelatus]|uniref:Nucleoside phosphorylase domain-containing protein n=1 Tax=Aspergillus pseudocaelatus TaxID=1825620 RepID=A0ABQ6W4L2_9EURO|nr:nucleoside phosphorylase domain-containing protein [Aspergillus pseudocaelatus]
MGSQRKRLTHRDYRIGWICALPKELTVAIAMLDKEHERLSPASDRDDNTYVFGEIGNHNVVIACMPMGMTGNAPAALVAKDLLHSFRHLQFYLMVGIGGGAPQEHNDIRLGDVVVSAPTGQHGGVVQYDYGKSVADGVFHRTGTLNRPPSALLSTLSYLRSSYELLGRPNFLRHLSAARARYPHRAATFSYPSELSDTLFKADYDHVRPLQPCKAGCDHRRIVRRAPRPNNDPSVFFGNIASANQVMRHGLTRDRIAREHNVLCFEMEAAGLMDQFSCLVIRGISDYADTHKNDEWQDYASAVSAAFAKDLLLVTPARALSGELSLQLDTDSLHSDTPPADVHDDEDFAEEDLSEEDVDDEDVDKEDLNEEGADEEDLSEEDVDEEDLNEEDLSEEDVDEEDLNEEDVDEEDLNEEDVDEEELERQSNKARSNFSPKLLPFSSTANTTQTTASNPSQSQDSPHSFVVTMQLDKPPAWARLDFDRNEAFLRMLTAEIPVELDPDVRFQLSRIMEQPPVHKAGVVYICDVQYELRRSSDTRLIMIGVTSDINKRLKAHFHRCAYTRLRLITSYPRSKLESDTHKQIRNRYQVESLVHRTLGGFRYDKQCGCGKNHKGLFEISEHEIVYILDIVEHWVSWSERKLGHALIPHGA